MSAGLWEWEVDRGIRSSPTGVCGSRHRAMEKLSRSLVKADGPASGYVVPVSLVDDKIGFCYERLSALKIRANFEKGVIRWKLKD